MSFWGELKRRNVYKVGVAYAIVAWLLIQAASIIFPHMRLPEWAVPLVIAFLIIGFPIALLLAWAYEVTPEGIKRTKEVPLAESITHLTGQKLNYIVTGLLVIAVGLLAFKVFFLDRRATEPEMVSTESKQAPVVTDVEEVRKTIAVIPFVNLSPDPDQEYFVDGLSEELLNSLTNIPNLRVTARTSSFSFKGSDKTVQEIASVLGVENILEGSVRKADSMLRVTAQLVRASDGFHLWSKTYDRELKDIFAVQEDIATAVANELKITLGIGRSLKQLGGTDNVEAYQLYLITKSKKSEIFSEFNTLESIDKVIALDPNFALAWALKASIHQSQALIITPNLVAVELDKGLKAAQKAIELEPNLAEAYAVMGNQRAVENEWIEAELSYRKAFSLATESTQIAEDYSNYLFAVGYLEKVNKFLETARLSDPLNQRINEMYINSLIFFGDWQRIEEEHKHAVELLGDRFDLTGGSVIRINFKKEVSLDNLVNVPLFPDEEKKRIKSREDLLAYLRRSLSGEDHPPLFIVSQYAAYLDDAEFSMDVIEKTISLQSISTFGNIYIWFPVYHDVRQLPRFKEYVREIGLVDYWNEFGWPDICHQLDNGDFVCE